MSKTYIVYMYHILESSSNQNATLNEYLKPKDYLLLESGELILFEDNGRILLEKQK